MLKKFKKTIILFLVFVISFLHLNFYLTQIFAAEGVPLMFSYQGRLSDSSGNLLGGSGTNYYFKFSIWDNSTVGSGSRLWPASSPGTFTSLVRQGVFNVNIGDTSNGYPDILNYNFSSDAVYLQVEVSSDGVSFETLSPRQRITSTPFAQLAGRVYSTSGLSVFPNASSSLQSVLDSLFVGRNSTTTIRGEFNSTSTFAGGIDITRGVNLNSGYLFGAGLTSCSGSSDKLIWNSSTGQFGCGVDAGGSGSGITGLRGEYSSYQTGASQTFATSSDTNIGLTITSIGDVHTFTPTWSGTLSVSRGGTGANTFSSGQILYGSGSGAIQTVATSTPTIGSSLSYTGSLGNLIGGFSGTLSLNLANTNNWTALQTFSFSSTTYASFDTASTTNLNIGGQSFTSLLGSGLQNTAGALTLNATGNWTGTLDGFEGSDLYSFQRVSTSSTPNIGEIAYWTSNGTPSTLSSVATGTISVPTGLTITANRYVLGGNATIGLDSGYVIPLQTTLDSKLSSYDAWTHPSYGGSATTSLITLSNGFLSTASSTIVGNATTTGGQYIGRLYGASLSACNPTTEKLLWNANGTFSCGSDAGAGGGITSLGALNQSQTGSSQTLATSTSSFNGLTLRTTIVSSGDSHTFTPSMTGTLDNTGLTNSSITINGSNVSLGSSITVSSTTLLSDSNSWNGTNRFSFSSTTYASFDTASTTNLNIGGQSFTSLLGSGLQNTAGALTLNATGNWTGTLDGFEGSDLYSFQRVSTSSTPNIGEIAYWTSNGTPSTLSSVATGTISVPTGLTITANRYVLGGNATIGLDSGYVIPLQTTLDSKLSSYDAWTHPSYGGSATTSLITLSNGFLSTASSTIVGNATTTGGQYIGRLYGASLSACNPTTEKLLWNANGTFSCGSDAGAGGGITSLGALNQSQTGSSQTLATSTSSFNGLTLRTTIVSSGDSHTFTPSMTGTLDNTGLTNSSITINGSNVSLGSSITVSSTTLLSDSNSWNGTNRFSFSSTTYASFDTASTTNLNIGGQSFTSLLGSGLQNTAGALTLNATGNWTGTLDGFEGSDLYSFQRVSTSSTPNIGEIAYWTSNGTPSTLSSVATGTISVPTGLTITANRYVLGGNATIGLDSGYVIPLQTTLDSKLSSYDAWTHPSYGGSATTSLITLSNGFLSTASSTIVGNATTTGGQYIGRLYGASLSACNPTTEKLLWNANGTFSCGSDAGAGGGITSLGALNQSQTGSSQTLATSTSSFNGLTLRTTIVSSGDSHTFTPSMTGTLDNTGLTNSSITINGSNVSLGSSITVSSTTLLSDSNSWNGTNRFSFSSTTYASFDTASTTNLNIGGQSFTSLLGSGLQNTAGALTLNATGNWTGTLDGFEGSDLYSFQRVSTSSTPNIGEIAYWTSNGTPSTLSSVATGTISVPTGLTITANRYVLGGNATIGLDSGYVIPLQTTLDSKLSSYDAWTHPSYGGSATTSLITLSNGFLSTASSTIVGNATTTGTLGVGRLFINNDYITDLTGTGLAVSGGVLNTSNIPNASLQNSTISGISLGSNLADLTATDSTLTFSGSYNGGTARTVGLNLANANTWTAKQNFFGSASSTLLSTNQAWFGGTATTTFTNDGKVGIASSSPFARVGIETQAGDIWGFAVGSSTKSLLSVSTEGFGTTTLSGLNIAGLATTTSNVGINLSNGCFAINNNCISGGSGGSPGGSGTELQFRGGASTFSAVTNSAVDTNGVFVGIGTTTPRYLLNLATSTRAQLALQGTDTDSPWFFRSIGNNLYIGTSSPTTFATSTLSFLNFTNAGRLGISTSTPGAILSVENISTAASFIVSDQANDTTPFIIDASGNVGVGTGSPTNTLTVTGSFYVHGSNNWDSSIGAETSVSASDAAGSYLLGGNNNNGSSGSEIYAGGGNNTSGGEIYIRAGDATLTRGGSVRINAGSGTVNGVIRIGDEYGNVGIGTSTPVYRLTVASSTALTDGAGIAQWVTRNAGGNLYFSTTTVAGTATTSISALEISGSGFGTTTVRGLNIAGLATTTSNVGINLSNGCFAINNNCISGGSGGSPGGSGTELQFRGGASTFSAVTNSAVDTNGVFVGIGTTTPRYLLNLATSTRAQLALQGTDTDSPWFFRSIGNNLYIGTSSPTTFATTTTSVLSFNGTTGSISISTSTAGTLKVTSSGVVWSDTSGGGAGYSTVQNEGSGLTARSILNFTGTGVNCVDDGVDSTDCTIDTSAASLSIGSAITSGTIGSVLFVGAGTDLQQDNANFFFNDTTNRLGLGTTTPFAKLSVNSIAGEPAFVVGSSTRTDFIVDSLGNVGIGTTSPFAKLSVIGGGNNGVFPALVVATTSNWTSDGRQAPMLYVTATTTGDLDYARVSIGTTTTPYGGGAGLRDQFTVAGRIYQTWRYISCDLPGTSATALGALSADGADACGDFSFDEVSVGTLAILTNGSVPYARLRGSDTPALSETSSIRSASVIGAASSSPVMEVLARNATAGAATNTVTIIGFSSTAEDTTNIGNDLNGIYFAASSTNNWQAIVKKNNASTFIDTGVASTTSGAFQRFRIEASSSTIYFLINGNVVAVHSSATTNNIPNANLYPVVSTGVYNTGLAGVDRDMFVSLIRVWTDDPPGELLSGKGSFDDPSFDPIQGADIAESYLTDDPSQFKEGMIVAEDLLGKVRLANEPYSRDILGSVSVSPHTVMGMENSSTTRVAMLGRVPLLISLQNGPIKKGDRITSSYVSGIGMRASRPGYIIGNTLQEFDPQNGVGQCIDNGYYGLATTTCYGLILVKLNPGFDMGIGNVVQDVGNSLVGAVEAAQELLNDAFTKGAELTRIVAGKVVAQFIIVKDMFASVITVLPSGEIRVPGGQDQVSGWSSINAGETSIFVNNNKVLDTSKIFLTPRALIATPLTVTEIQNGIGFKVEISTASSSTIPFDWLIINTYGENGPPNFQKIEQPQNIEPDNNLIDNPETLNTVIEDIQVTSYDNQNQENVNSSVTEIIQDSDLDNIVIPETVTEPIIEVVTDEKIEQVVPEDNNVSEPIPESEIN